jgi:hypothetical protein
MIGEPHRLKLSKRVTVEVGELDGYEEDLADSRLAEVMSIGGDPKRMEKPEEQSSLMAKMMLSGAKVFSICSIRKINETPVTPLRNAAQYAAAAKMLTVAEKRALTEWGAPLYSPTPAHVGKEPTAEGSEPQ